MATVHSYVDTSCVDGGNGTTSATTGANRAFATLSSALAALYIAYPNFVTSTVNPVIHCAASGSGADTTTPGAFAAFTSNATYYLVVQVDSANRHAGIYNTAKYRIELVADPVINNPPPFTRFIGLQILHGVDDYTSIFHMANGLASQGCQVLYCIGRYVDKNYTYGKQWYFLPGVDAFGGANVIIANCLFYGGVGTHGTGASYGYGSASTKAQAVLYNVTFIYGGTEAPTGAVAGIEDGYGVVKAVNCITIGYPSFGNPGATGTDYNAADVASVSGTHSRSSQTFTFVDSSGTPKKYQLASNDTGAKGYGLDLSSDATFPVTDDIAGTTRTTPWDIGPFMAQASAAAARPMLSVQSAVMRASLY